MSHQDNKNTLHEADSPLRDAFNAAFAAVEHYPALDTDRLFVSDVDGSPSKHMHTRTIAVQTADLKHWVTVRAYRHHAVAAAHALTPEQRVILDEPEPPEIGSPEAVRLDNDGLSVHITVQKAPPPIEFQLGVDSRGVVRRVLGAVGLTNLVRPKRGEEVVSRFIPQRPMGDENATEADLRWWPDGQGGSRLLSEVRRGSQYDKGTQKLLIDTGLDLIMPVDIVAQIPPERIAERVPITDPGDLLPLADLPTVVNNYIQH